VSRRRAAEVALIGVAAVWGGTFVVVQDAVQKLPTLAFLGFWIQTYAQKHTTSTRTAPILASEPAFTALCGYLFNDERLAAIGWA
jgi:drug/metabolite transporter (DMT)-like permease